MTWYVAWTNLYWYHCHIKYCHSYLWKRSLFEWGEPVQVFFYFNISIAVGQAMIKTGRNIITLTGISHIYLPAPAIFIYHHLPHLSPSTCHIYLPPPATFIYQHLPHLSTTTCHIYLPAPATFIYHHLPHLSTTTCHIYLPLPAFLTSNVVVFLNSVIWRKFFFNFIFNFWY
jgi:hypothetical protein